MTVYTVTNDNPITIRVEHVITNTQGFNYTFSSSIPARTTAEYHLRDIPGIPATFAGSMTLNSDQPFTAKIVGYDYPP